jgi:hypothetical protein
VASKKSGHLYYGSATKDAVDQFIKATATAIGKKCLIRVNIKTIAPLNRPPRETVRLLEFLYFDDV